MGRLFFYNLLTAGLDRLLFVDFYISGYPPLPTMIILEGLLQLIGLAPRITGR